MYSFLFSIITLLQLLRVFNKQRLFSSNRNHSPCLKLFLIFSLAFTESRKHLYPKFLEYSSSPLTLDRPRCPSSKVIGHSPGRLHASSRSAPSCWGVPGRCHTGRIPPQYAGLDPARPQRYCYRLADLCLAEVVYGLLAGVISRCLFRMLIHIPVVLLFCRYHFLSISAILCFSALSLAFMPSGTRLANFL